jgi:hypothetical protein
MNNNSEAGTAGPGTSQADDPLKANQDLFAPEPAPRRLALFFVVATGVAWFVGWIDPIIDRLFPSVTEVTGTVMLNGKPLVQGWVETSYDASGFTGGLLGGLPKAMSTIDSNGGFRLMTNGKPGAYCGKYRVLVNKVGNNMRSVVSERYTNPNKTPFRITIKRGQANHIDLVLEDP